MALGRRHLAFDPSGRPLFTLGYSLQAYINTVTFPRRTVTVGWMMGENHGKCFSVGMLAPRSVSVTVKRPARPREYLTEREIEKLI